MLKVYNTLKREKEEFTPIAPPQVNMYVCGVTVYDYCHLGHARAYIVFDMIRRYLEYKNYKVNYIQNFTDIDDKIIRKAQATETTAKAVTEKFIQEYFQDFDRLNIQRADKYPKATESIPLMIELIRALIEKGHAYPAPQGDVYFDVASFPGYGKLSGRKFEDNEAGARVAVDENKKNPLDFALWKSAKPDEPFWESPWGKGRPGWHIECSVMSLREAGVETLDIHGGGQDLVFPHHENEIAQSEAFTGKPFAKYWLHNGFVNINNEKMSKSLGNFFTIRDILKKYDPEVVRFYILSTHYRSPINFSDDQLEEAKKRLEYLYQSLYENYSPQNPIKEREKTDNTFTDFKNMFEKYMDDDFNSAGAIGVLFGIANYSNKFKSPTGAELLKKLGSILGILQKEKTEDIIPEEINALIQKRQEARKNKNFAESDRIRDELLAKGIVLKDTPQGVVFEKK